MHTPQWGALEEFPLICWSVPKIAVLFFFSSKTPMLCFLEIKIRGWWWCENRKKVLTVVKIRKPAREWWFILKFCFLERHLRKLSRRSHYYSYFAACSCCHGPRGKINQTEDSSSVRSAVSHHSALCHYNIKKVKKEIPIKVCETTPREISNSLW